MPSCTGTHKSNKGSARNCCKRVSDEDISEQNVFSHWLEITLFLKTDFCWKSRKQGWKQNQLTKHLKTPYDPNPIEEENVSTALFAQSSTFSFSVVLWCITQCINQDSATVYTVIWKTNSLSAKLHYIAELWSCQHKRNSHVHPQKKGHRNESLLNWSYESCIYYAFCIRKAQANLGKLLWFFGRGLICSHHQMVRFHTTLHIGSHHSSTHQLQALHSIFFVSPVVRSNTLWEIWAVQTNNFNTSRK